jgi:hypothetical protein
MRGLLNNSAHSTFHKTLKTGSKRNTQLLEQVSFKQATLRALRYLAIMPSPLTQALLHFKHT